MRAERSESTLRSLSRGTLTLIEIITALRFGIE